MRQELRRGRLFQVRGDAENDNSLRNIQKLVNKCGLVPVSPLQVDGPEVMWVGIMVSEAGCLQHVCVLSQGMPRLVLNDYTCLFIRSSCMLSGLCHLKLKLILLSVMSIPEIFLPHLP